MRLRTKCQGKAPIKTILVNRCALTALSDYEKADIWNEHVGYRQAKFFIAVPNRTKTKQLLNLYRKKSSGVSGLLTVLKDCLCTYCSLDNETFALSFIQDCQSRCSRFMVYDFVKRTNWSKSVKKTSVHIGPI